jgi:glycosyltransferase involved in cell wall biosynthesis
MAPRLADLPAPPAGNTGWPWTVEAPQLPSTRPDGSPWPRISIVTPSYNQARFIEETIRSVLLQGYPDLEYIIMDGASSDGSVEIIRKYAPWLTFWVSEPDGGQSQALNRGLQRGTGQILSWLNSDDVYRENVLAEAAVEFAQRPGIDVVSGVVRQMAGVETVRVVGPSPLRTLEDFCLLHSNWTQGRLLVQPEAFFSACIYAEAGPLREDLNFCFDAMFWVAAAAKGAQFASVDRHWVDFRLHDAQKTHDFVSSRQEFARAVFAFCATDASVDKAQLARIGADLVRLFDDLIDLQRGQLTAYRQSTSYRLGRLITRLRFW